MKKHYSQIELEKFDDKKIKEVLKATYQKIATAKYTRFLKELRLESLTNIDLIGDCHLHIIDLDEELSELKTTVSMIERILWSRN